MAQEILLLDHSTDFNRLFPLGKIQLFKVDSLRISVTRTVNGFVAFDNHCPHAGYALNEGHINFENQLTCPLHHYTFNLKTGKEEEGQCKDLHFYQVHFNKNGDLLLSISQY